MRVAIEDALLGLKSGFQVSKDCTAWYHWARERTKDAANMTRSRVVFVRASSSFRSCIIYSTRTCRKIVSGSKLAKAKEIVGVLLPVNECLALPLNPGEKRSTSQRRMERLKLHRACIGGLLRLPRCGAIIDAILSKLRIQRIAVIGANPRLRFRLGFEHVEAIHGAPQSP